MSDSQIQKDITLQEYFEQKLPQIFAEAVRTNPPTDLAGEEYRLAYDIEGTRYGFKVVDGTRLEVVLGGLENSHLTTNMTEADWRDVVLGNVTLPNPLLEYNTRKRLDKIKALKGVFKLRLSRDAGELFNSTTTFNEASEPVVTIIAKASDYALIQTGKLNAQMAMMTGKVRFEGNLAFLMSLSTLTQ